MAIDTSGLFPAKETKVFAEFGKAIKERFSHLMEIPICVTPALFITKAAHRGSTVVIMVNQSYGMHGMIY